jgi:hypothetical protein
LLTEGFVFPDISSNSHIERVLSYSEIEFTFHVAPPVYIMMMIWEARRLSPRTIVVFLEARGLSEQTRKVFWEAQDGL